jgi:hypothetical protein
MKLRLNKAISSSIALLMLVIVIVVVAIPMMEYISTIQQEGVSQSALVNNYVYLKSLQSKQVEYGHPAIYYGNSSILFYYTNGTFVPPTNITITKILYLSSSGIWTNLTSLKYPLTVTTFTNITLPPYVQGRPIIVVTSLGNLFFLTPMSSIGPYSTSGKGGFEVATQIYESSGPITVSTNLTTNIDGSYKNFTTPVAFVNQTGTFSIRIPQYVYYVERNGSVITGVFRNWIELGQGILNSSTSNEVTVTLEGSPLVLIGNYSPLNAQDQVTIQVNPSQVEPVEVIIDGVHYTISGTKNLNIPAGFVNFTVVTTSLNYTISRNIIEHFEYQFTSVSGRSFSSTSFITFLNPDTHYSFIVSYNNDYNYYGIYIEYSHIKYPYNVTRIEPYPYKYFNPNNPQEYGLYFQLGNNLYNYSNSTPYYIKSGNYNYSAIGIYFGQTSQNFYVYFTNYQIATFKGLTWGPYEYYVNGTPISSDYIDINSPLIITVVYTWTEGYNNL